MSINLENFKEDLNTIINNSANIDSNEKALFRNLFNKLSDYTDFHVNNIKETVKEQLESNFGNMNTDFEVRTVLANKIMKESFIAQRSYCPVICEQDETDENNKYFGVFFDCTYEKFRDICAKISYNAVVTLKNSDKPVECLCTLVPDSVFVQYEEILYRIARQYGVKKPLIFSPYARKFALIKFRNNDFKTSDIADIKFTDINEKYMPTTEYTLMWNVLIEDTDEYTIPCTEDMKISPYFNSVDYRRVFLNTPENVYFVFCFRNTEKFYFVRKEDMLYVSSDVDLTTVPYEKVTLLNDFESTECFRNYFKPNTFSGARVRSQADIIYTLNSFNNNPYDVVISEDIRVVSDSKKIPESLKKFKNYNSDVSYYADTAMNTITYESIARSRRLRSSLYCIVPFSGGEIREDYANYVIEYLNEMYPEFNWIGVDGNGLDMAKLFN